MFLSLLLIALIAFGGLALTYVFADDEPLMWRLAAGNIVGSAVFGTAAFLLASAAGLNTVTVLIALALTILPVLLLKRHPFRKQFARDKARAKDKMQGANRRKAPQFLYYVFYLLFFLTFFGRAMIETAEGIFTGGSNNLGDLPFHLGAIFSFTEGNNFPPQNPSFAGTRFSYPFIPDLLTACFMKLGIGVRDAMLMQNVSWAFSLLVLFERFVFKLVRSRLAGKIAPTLLFFSGGLGFLWFFSDYWEQANGFFDFLNALPKDYTIGNEFRWGNSLTTLFLTQRSLLLGMPLTLIVLGILWTVFTEKRDDEIVEIAAPEKTRTIYGLAPLFATGLLAGLLPLVHLHSLAVLFVVGVFVLIIRPDKWREWLAFAVGVAVLAVPELLWSMSGSASETAKFFDWHFGWDKRETNFLWFWIKNTGIFIPLVAAGLWLIYAKRSDVIVEEPRKGKGKKSVREIEFVPNASLLLLFYLPFVFLFVVSNIAKLAPWEWDNIKVLIYWYAASVLFAALLLAWLWQKGGWFRAAAGALFVILILSGSLDVWRTVSGQINYIAFNKDAAEIAHQIDLRTDPKALFLNAPTYNSAIVMSGRQSVMRYPGHLGSHGIDYAEREADVKEIYAGGPRAGELLDKYGVQFVLLSPEERNLIPVNDDYFRQFPVLVQVGQYTVFRVR